MKLDVLRIGLMLVAACSAAPDPGPSPITIVTTESGTMTVEVRTQPSPLIRGTSDIELRVTDAANQPVDGLQVTVVPWMVSHAHGTSVTPIVTPQGDGRYLAERVSLFMPGTWQLRTTFEGTVTDRATPSLDVP